MKTRRDDCDDARICCPDLPELRRVTYRYGQLLDAQDFLDEQTYFREKIKLHNRCLHGFGVVCGLEVAPEPLAEPCEPQDDRARKEIEAKLAEAGKVREDLEAQLAEAREAGDEAAVEELRQAIDRLREEEEALRRQLDELCPPYDPGQDNPTRVVVDCGVALDCLGNEIVLRRPLAVDLWQALDDDGRRRVGEGTAGPLWLSICYCEMPVEPVRPIYTDTCEPAGGCLYAKRQDSFRIEVGLEQPPPDTRCDPCCCPCDEPCLVLARIDNFRPGQPLAPEDVHNDVRRPVAVHDWAVITGIGWVHGGAYTDDEAAVILGREDPGAGAEIRFSRGVRGDGFLPGVIEIEVTEAGSGRSASIYHVEGEYVGLPAGDLTTSVRYRQTTRESFQEGDRVLIRVRTDFLLDECCQPVDGNHVGGRVPLIPGAPGEHPEPGHDACLESPHRRGPWTSGNRRGGGVFESWFYIRES